MRSSGRMVAAVLTTVLLSLPGAGAVAGAESDSGKGVPLEERHVPTVVNAPGAWASIEEVRWPVAAFGIATRKEPVGLFDETESVEVFAVSAVDGHAAWIRPPGYSVERWELYEGMAVSPDGEWIGLVKPHPSARRRSGLRVAGWLIMNTTTGRTVELEVPGHPWVRGTMQELTFSGDSQHLVTSYEVPGQRKASRSRAHQFVAWDVQDGAPTVLEEPGRSRLPILGSAPTGVVWARGGTVFRVTPGSADTRRVSLPAEVMAASWGPDDKSFAYIARTPKKPRSSWRLYAGRTVKQSRDRLLDLPADIDPSQLLGWRNATHVVVGHYGSSVHVVDIVTGEVEEIDLAGTGGRLNAPIMAEGLWQQSLLEPLAPDHTKDPRTPWLWGGGLLLAVGAGVLTFWWRRSSRRFAASPAAGRSRLALPQLGAVATGVLVVMIDLRVQEIDLVPDPLGWAMAATALMTLRRAHDAFHIAGSIAWLAVIPSVFGWIGLETQIMTWVVDLVLVPVQFLVCTALIAVRPERGAETTAIRWLLVGLGGALLLAIFAALEDPGFQGLAFVLGAANLAVSVWFVVLLYAVAKEVAPPTAAAPQTDPLPGHVP